MQILPIDEDHLEELYGLHINVYSQPPWNEHWERQWVDDRYQLILSSKLALGFVAIKNDRVCGAILGRGIPFKGELEFEVCELFVANDLQREGVGQSLINHLYKTLSYHGMSYIILMTKRDSTANDFYLKSGFNPIDELRFFYKKVQN